MVFQDPYFHALRRRLQAAPYDEARRRLTARLAETAPHPPRPPHLTPDEIAQREQWLYREGLDLYLPILRTVLRAIAREVEAGLVEPTELDPEELTFATYQRARSELRELPQLPRDRFAWLRRLAHDTVHRAALARHAERHRGTASEPTEHPEAPPAELQGTAARLAAALADPDLPLPDDLLADPETRRLLDQLLDRLPEQWRETYLLSALDRWSDEQIAAVTGLLPDEVRALVHATVRLLRAWLEESTVQPTRPKE